MKILVPIIDYWFALPSQEGSGSGRTRANGVKPGMSPGPSISTWIRIQQTGINCGTGAPPARPNPRVNLEAATFTREAWHKMTDGAALRRQSVFGFAGHSQDASVGGAKVQISKLSRRRNQPRCSTPAHPAPASLVRHSDGLYASAALITKEGKERADYTTWVQKLLSGSSLLNHFLKSLLASVSMQ